MINDLIAIQGIRSFEQQPFAVLNTDSDREYYSKRFVMRTIRIDARQ